MVDLTSLKSLFLGEEIAWVLYVLRMNIDYFSYRIDLHDNQFCQNNKGQVICIDPVIFE